MKNLSLNYSIQGEGEPLLIIHGLFGSSRNWKSLGKKFAQYFQVILLDLRNHGDSEFDSVMDYDVMVDDVLNLMNKLGIESSHIIGHSMGGKVAMKLNQLYPERVMKLVVADIAPVGYTHGHDDIIKAVLDLDLEQISSRKEADNQLKNAIPDPAVRQFILQNLAVKQNEAHWTLNWKVLEASMHLLTGYEDINHWQIHNPVLFIRGDKSNYVSRQNWSLIVLHFTSAEMVTLQDAGHWLHAEQPAAFFEAVLKFLQS